ncbi:MAG: transposase [Candidatus Endonucleobacter bathymodioli]|uniref:Mutator family transposase n=1 Tax=Candidatus Endonucleibacter bathymodioli TaxID=539814 RepID=A0AA90SE67_9GAMM|nr:transposase [Candidatus Endonucleobacter bathymodioli]
MNKAIYLALGVNTEGHKELLGMWLSANEGAKFWLGILTELKTRGLEDILIACVDGVKSFPEAIQTVYPKNPHSAVHCPYGTQQHEICAFARLQRGGCRSQRIYQSTTEDEALRELDQVEEKWRVKYPLINRSWRKNWDNLNTLFAYPPEIRKAIYTTNAIESLNSVIRKAIKKRKLFPHDDSAKKVVYLATREASKRWTMPIHNWRAALNHLMIVFEDRLSDHI